MFNRKLKYSVILSLSVLGVIFACIIHFSQEPDKLRVVFLDVGQGDAILISKGNYQMLIDGGRDGKLLLNKLGKYIPFWDRNVEVILATHPDQDHIAGLIDVLQKYNVKNVLKTQDKSESQTYKKFEEEIGNEKSENIDAKKEVSIKISDDAGIEIVYPFSETGDIADNKSNEGSVVVKINYGENSFLLTGDLPKEQEIEIVNSGINIASTIFKIAHHGSKYSNSAGFLEKVNPIQTIISVGKDNSYGHPSGEVVNFLKEKNISVFRTDERGDIAYECAKDSCKAN
jgi:competence protein ComEC